MKAKTFSMIKQSNRMLASNYTRLTLFSLMGSYPKSLLLPYIFLAIHKMQERTFQMLP